MFRGLWTITRKFIWRYNIYWIGLILTMFLVAQVIYGNWAGSYELLYSRIEGLNEIQQRIDNWVATYGIEHEDAAGLWETYFKQEKVVRETYQSLPAEASYKAFGRIVNSGYYMISRQILAALFIALILIQEFVRAKRSQKLIEPPLTSSLKE